VRAQGGNSLTWASTEPCLRSGLGRRGGRERGMFPSGDPGGKGEPKVEMESRNRKSESSSKIGLKTSNFEGEKK